MIDTGDGLQPVAGTESLALLAAVADTLVPGARIEDDGTLRTALAPVARAVAARGAGEFGAWTRPQREVLIGELLGDPQAATVLRRVLGVAARTFYGDPASWPALGYRHMQPGTSWPPGPGVAPEPIAPGAVADEYDVV